jgi:hypothetical protein
VILQYPKYSKNGTLPKHSNCVSVVELFQSLIGPGRVVWNYHLKIEQICTLLKKLKCELFLNYFNFGSKDDLITWVKYSNTRSSLAPLLLETRATRYVG